MQHDLQELNYILQIKNNEQLPVVDRESIADLLKYSYTLYGHYKTQKKQTNFHLISTMHLQLATVYM